MALPSLGLADRRDQRSAAHVQERLRHGSRGALVREGSGAIPSQGLVVGYLDGWRYLATSHFSVRQPDGSVLSLRSSDAAPRAKKFVFIPHAHDPASMNIELFLDANAPSGT